MCNQQMCAYNKHTLETSAAPLDALGLNISRHLACIWNDTQDYKHGRQNVFKELNLC